MRSIHWAFLAMWAFALAACGGETTQPVVARVEVVPADSIDFGVVATGMAARHELRIENRGKGTVHLEAVELPEGFALERQRLSLQARESVALQVEFLPRQEQTYEGWVGFGIAGSQEEVGVEVRGEGRSAPVEVEDTLDFGGVFLSRSKSLTLDLRNSTDRPLELEVTVEGDAGYSVSPSALAMPPRGMGSLEVVFFPRERGPAAASLLVKPCPRCEETRVSLRGSGLLARLVAVPDPLDFGLVPLGLVGRRALTVRSASDGPISLGAVSWASGSTGWFSVEEEPLEAKPLEPGEEVDLMVTFTPDADGRYRDILTLRDVDGHELLEVEVRGEEGGPRLSLSPPRLDFGIQPRGRGLTSTVTVENVGAPGQAWMRGAWLEGEGEEAFSVALPGVPIDVGQAPVEVEVSLDPVAVGRWEAALVLETDLAAQAELRLPVSADVIDPTPCNLVADRAELRFGRVPSGYDGVRWVTVRNEGGQPCLVWGVHVLHADEAEHFRLDLSLEDVFTLEAQESLELPIRFDAREAPVRAHVEAELVIPHGRVEDPALVLPLNGMRMSWDWHTPPTPPSFEATPVGRATVAEAIVPFPCSRTIFNFAMAAESSHAFQLPASQSRSMTCGGGDSEEIRIRIAFLPEREGLHKGQLELRDSRGNPIFLDFEAMAIPACDDCDWPEAHCLEDTTLHVREQLQIHDDWPHECGWGIMRPPSLPGFEEGVGGHHLGWRYGLLLDGLHEPSTVCTGTFLSNIAATHPLGNSRVRPDGRAAYCESTIQVLPPDGLWVEVFGAGEMGGLYALRGMGGDPTEESSWLDGTFVCPTRETTGDPCPWGDPGPVVHRGERAIQVEGPEVGEPYHLGLRIYQPVDLGIRVYCGGQLAHEGTMSLEATEWALVVLGSAHFDTPTSCTFTSDGVTSFPRYSGPELGSE